MTNWKKYKLGELMDVQSGYAFKSGDLKTFGVPIIKIKNIQPPNISFDEADYYAEEINGRLNQFVIKKKDILISMTGSHVGQFASAVGKVGRYGFDKPALLNQRVGKLYAKDKSQLNEDFLYYLIARTEVQFELATNAGGSANQANISPQLIKNLEFDIPCIEAQTRIASILSSLDDKIELNRRMNQTLEQIAATLFKKYFVDDIDEDNLPEGWRWGKVSELLELIYGKALKERDRKVGKYPVVGSSGIVGFHDQYIAEGNGIVVGRKGNAGSVIWMHDKFYPIDTTFYVKNIDAVQGMYYYYFLLKDLNLGNLNSDSAVPGLNRNEAHNQEILVPKTEVIIQFNKIASSFFNKVKSNEKEIKSLTIIRNTLLPKLMSGEIDVTAINQNEPLHEEVFS